MSNKCATCSLTTPHHAPGYIICHRYPETIRKAIEDFCGDWREKAIEVKIESTPGTSEPLAAAMKPEVAATLSMSPESQSRFKQQNKGRR
jgi:hypothetical protein